jgi:hypothetical protein
MFPLLCCSKEQRVNQFEEKLETVKQIENQLNVLEGKDERRIFPVRLTEETFVHMATEAIVNPEACEYIKECLPKSYDMFIEILEKVSGVTLYEL